MRALVQRVSEASVRIDGRVVGEIGLGLLVFLGIRQDDTETEARQLARKIVQLRVFADDQDKMNLSVREVSGNILVVSQFTLYGETRKGNRPSYSQAARPERAKPLYEQFVRYCTEQGVLVTTGVFQAKMDVYLVNHGPVTLWCSTES